ncbi:MAG: hypothetical protein HDR33_01915 [Treponema sp.]|nr:hypothetical protein [Treponema sp.]
MIARYWGYNADKNKFEPLRQEPLSLFPTVIEPKTHTVFCRRCHCWECIRLVGRKSLMSQCGKVYTRPFVTENKLVDYGYDIQKRDNAYFIRIRYQRASNENRRLMETSYFLDFDRKVLLRNGKSVFDSRSIENRLPKEITKIFLDEMSEQYKEQFGICPTVSSSLEGFSVIIGYMLSPFNVNFYKIAQHWGLNPYDKNFSSLSSGDTPTAENEMFESLGIKPTKRIRRLYQEFPQAVVCYAVAKDLGFTDVNILQKTPGAHFYAFLKFYMISFTGGEISYPLRDPLRAFVHDMLEFASQKTVWNSIERTVKHFFTGSKNIVTDGINTYLHVHIYLTYGEKKEILKEGFNQYAHDFLVRRSEVVVQQEVKVKEEAYFDIDAKFFTLEYKTGKAHKRVYNPKTKQEELVPVPDEERFCFYVARNQRTLKEIGEGMKNCVGWGYTNYVLGKKCVIIYAKYNNKYRICIELFYDFTIGQALGPCNNPLGGDELEAYHEWCKEKHIRFEKAFRPSMAR